jgi:hypothetical protein
MYLDLVGNKDLSRKFADIDKSKCGTIFTTCWDFSENKKLPIWNDRIIIGIELQYL